MIRCSVNNDKEEIISLWHEAFGDNREEIEFFLENKYIPQNTVVCEENGKIISQLFLLEGDMQISGEDYPSYYLYAACTSKEHRGKGIMSKMLDFSRNLASGRGKYFICLMPAEESLYDYYSKFGYETVFKRKIINSTVNELKKLGLSQNNLSDFSLKTSEKARDAVLYNTDYFKWDRQSVEFAFAFHKLYGGCIFRNRKGYLLYTADDDCLCVKESAFTQEMLAKKLIELCNENKTDNFEVVLPVSFNFFDITGETKPNGMILCVNDDYKNILESCKDAYLGLTLD